MQTFSDFTSRALVPEHLEHYVRAVSTCTPLRMGPFLAWRNTTSLILAGFPCDSGLPTFAEGSPVQEPAKTRLLQELDQTLQEAQSLPWVETITLLAPVRPGAVPGNATCHEDAYFGLDLPLGRLGGKLGNMLRRGRTLTEITVNDTWSREHEALVAQAVRVLGNRPGEQRLLPEHARLFARLGHYVTANPGKVCCYSARRRDNGSLCGLVLGDHASYTTSFYLFAFRSPDAPPGTADVLLHSLCQHSVELGQVRCNLGLGIHGGIRFFKAKWGASLWMPCHECSWSVKKRGFLARLLSR